MANVLLFHHALGLTAGVRTFADALRRAGHVVHAPDLFDGRVFDRLDDGVALVERLGMGEIVARGERAASSLPEAIIYVGFSLGVMPAQKLAQTRAGARGAVFAHACAPPDAFGAFGAWPAGVPVQIHAMDRDPIFVGDGDLAAARALVASGASVELFSYEGEQHLFADASLPSYDRDAATLLERRVLDFLAAHG